MRRISTHVLDTARGRPAASLVVRLERADPSGAWRQLSSLATDQDGRCAELLPDGEPLREGDYRLAFETADYFAAQGGRGLYPRVEITFHVARGESHFHLPLLLAPNGYTTYRGS